MPKIVLYTVDGFTAQLPALSKKYGKKEDTVRNRMKHGMSLEEALKTPLRSRGTDNISILKEVSKKPDAPKKKELKFIRVCAIGGYYDYV